MLSDTLQTDMIENLKNVLAFDENLEMQKELVRRKLDFEVIKDNYQNKVTQTILDKFADLDQGMPGTNFKHLKIRELLKERQ